MKPKITSYLKKKKKKKIVCLTAYSNSISKILDKHCDLILVGDSLANVLYGMKTTHQLKLETIIPLQGPAIKGKKHVLEVLNQHIEFFENCIEMEGKSPKSWARPAQTALWFTPHPPWPLEEREEIN